ncbi:MAG: hypothetical protein IPM96_21715 [Ignavibacteria bacterium]|nr:hypothetical protein [Ignavibacteria bacterium]
MEKMDYKTVEGLMNIGRKHWKQHLPKMYKDLKKMGTLEAELKERAELQLEDWDRRVKEAMETMNLNQLLAEMWVWETTREIYILLTPEREVEAYRKANKEPEEEIEALRLAMMTPEERKWEIDFQKIMNGD